MQGKETSPGGGHASHHPLAVSPAPPGSPALVAPDPGALRVNLSYVLHEPSWSRVVTEHVQLVLRQAKRARRAVHQLANLPDGALVTRIVARDDRALDRLQRDCPSCIVSIDLGASPLLRRVLPLILPSGRPPPDIIWLDRPSPQSIVLELFGRSVRLAVPQLDAPILWFAILVSRPGWNSLLLDAVWVTGEHLVSHLALTIERVLRDYTDQWWAQRAWWDRPAEMAYPELREEAQ
ncbi:hypothetical protein OO015_01800 [Thermomicrobium sp. 4228-Ro]|uniref:hypothetical protein n=1 Tax=Thermomicrobium sp. 4228-Ro TaxID=2993937 RepID=UPI002249762C|nr:hypothetical protein [Thermomicrobium sp. 4228-Ro]MCX2726229.1 hypothetical protein [Thermomicrobium sp. 4228-Ro]